MRTAKKLLFCSSAILLGAVLLLVAAPKAVRATVAALVQVVNTTANPVPVIDADVATAFVAQGYCNFAQSPSCDTAPLYSVPAGKTAVFDSFSTRCFTNGTTISPAIVIFSAPDGTQVDFSMPLLAAGTDNGTLQWANTLNVKSYAAGGTSGTPVQLAIGTAGVQNVGNFCTFTLSGHLQ